MDLGNKQKVSICNLLRISWNRDGAQELNKDYSIKPFTRLSVLLKVGNKMALGFNMVSDDLKVTRPMGLF